jgi:ParB family chromosome partitioning protein
VRQIRKLRLLATVHPAILDQIGAGDMPKEQELRTIAAASREDQAAVWKKFKPRKGEGAQWWQINQALQKTRFFARDAKFGEDERAAFGILWQEDLFAEGDEDNRFTLDGEAFISAQRAWLDANMPKNGEITRTGPSPNAGSSERLFGPILRPGGISRESAGSPPRSSGLPRRPAFCGRGQVAAPGSPISMVTALSPMSMCADRPTKVR